LLWRILVDTIWLKQPYIAILTYFLLAYINVDGHAKLLMTKRRFTKRRKNKTASSTKKRKLTKLPKKFVGIETEHFVILLDLC
jgi:hypothetical protein